MARLSTYHRLSDREAAQITLDRIVGKVGEAKARAVIEAAPALNAWTKVALDSSTLAH